jgi:cysteine desulfurase family protein (TIGR01976 family)
MIDPGVIRQHFPALERTDAHGRPLVFFDNPAGTQICREAIERMRGYLVGMNANHGGAFRASRESDAMVREARRAMADFLGAARPEEIVFGQNMTSLTMHVSRSLAQELAPGDELVVTRLDHDANVAPWLLAARDRDCEVKWVDFDPGECAWSADEVARQVTPRTKIVAVGYASNATGTINPVAEAVRIAHSVGALCVVDAVHYAPHGLIDVASLGCDLLVCSAYKFFGPHLGVLYGRYDLLDRLSAYKVRPSGDAPPDKFETGTQSFESIAGLLGAAEYLGWLGRTFGSAHGAPTSASPAPSPTGRAELMAAMEAIRGHETGLTLALHEGLADIGGLRLYGIGDPRQFHRRVPTFAFTLEGRHPRSICEELDKAGISAWDGNYYARETTIRLGLEGKGGMVRVGAAHYTTREEIDRLCAAVREIAAGARAG